ncbi:NAD-dependent epimerase/dehydratase family protein [Pontibacter sp. G13]|uniref:NAD-dependent epimerase/dehydratase family protein n=1 Tax=Pontibacter sp. G13 TaxID=3074898 RepID=UPI0028893D72|nr:NAD-dependent epimerase/dehydratase family protein [Pontibacter sp. G13]WNJ16192.1 NAD-dependent epimerase/dehydratase family protein [Pontibacter sp. G13]
MSQVEKLTGQILVIGAGGQIGSDLTDKLRSQYGAERVIAADIRPLPNTDGPTIVLDVLDREALRQAVSEYKIEVVYNLAAILSAKGEQNPELAWKINMDGLLNTLEVAREGGFSKLFWPSSIAVFGPNSPRQDTPQYCVMDPTTVYGISKLAGERWCEYYFNRYGVDVRSLRYPGLISYSAMPGGGTTDYAVDIFHQALKTGSYTSFLKEGTALPMMYMPDAIDATIQLMEADAERISIRSAYNLGGMSFTPEVLAAEVKKSIPGFQMSYAPDFRQDIADSWPQKIDDSQAQTDWDWEMSYDLATMTKDMIHHVQQRYHPELQK